MRPDHCYFWPTLARFVEKRVLALQQVNWLANVMHSEFERRGGWWVLTFSSERGVLAGEQPEKGSIRNVY